MLRRARVPTPAAEATATATAATPRRSPLPRAKEEAGPLRLFRVATDAVLYGTLAACWAHDFVGTVVEVLGRRVCGRGSTLEAVGINIRACCLFIIVLLAPSFLPLVMMRVEKHAKLALKEEEREKQLESNRNVMVGSVNEQVPKKNRAVSPRLPKGVKVAPLYALLHIVAFMFLATMIQLRQEQGSVLWRLADVLFDVARLGFAVVIGVLVVPNAVILVTVPKAKDSDDQNQTQ